MPGRDGTGPMGRGCATGRGLGRASGRLAGSNQFAGRGLGLGMGNRGVFNNATNDAVLAEENEKLRKEVEELKQKKSDE